MASGPSTPNSRHNIQYPFKPLNSSPLASPSPSRSSPLVPSSLGLASAPERRRLQFKSQNSISPLSRSSTLPSSFSSSTSRPTPPSRTRGIPRSSSGTDTATSATRPHFTHAEDPQKQFLRQRIKAKCIERAQKARTRAVKQRRYTGYSDRSSDSFEMDEEEEEEENDDDVMSDEFFRRIMAQTNRKTEHTYRLSYAQEVGSSFDPDMEDVEEWEHEFQGRGLDPSPVNWDDEELEAYAEECTRQGALDDLADIPEEELFNLHDIDDLFDEPSNVVDHMDLS